MLAGAIVGAPAQAGATSSTDVRQPQRAGCIATPSEFDLLQTQHSEYTFDRLARPRDIREFLSEMRRRATKQEMRLRAHREARRGCFDAWIFLLRCGYARRVFDAGRICARPPLSGPGFSAI